LHILTRLFSEYSVGAGRAGTATCRPLSAAFDDITHKFSPQTLTAAEGLPDGVIPPAVMAAVAVQQKVAARASLLPEALN